jgi:hypothetical protein
MRMYSAVRLYASLQLCIYKRSPALLLLLVGWLLLMLLLLLLLREPPQ